MPHHRWTLQERREELAVTQTELAARAEVSITTVREIEQCVRVPTTDTAERIADALGVRMDEIRWPTRETRVRLPPPPSRLRRQEAALAAR